MSDGIRGLLSRDGQVRRRALNELGQSLEYYTPPELRPLLSFLGEMTPTAAYRAVAASRDAPAPDPSAAPQNMLDLDPQSFAIALDEGRRTPEERAFLLEQYRVHRSPFTNLLSRIEDRAAEDEEAGMRRGDVLPMRSPEGMTGFEALLEGEAEFARPAMFDAVAGAGARAVDTPGLLLGGVPMLQEEADRGAMAAADFAVPGAIVARGAQRAVDAAQLRQAQRFRQDIEPQFPGAPYASTRDSPVQFYHPSRQETRQIIGRDGQTPTAAQQRYLEDRKRAYELRQQGVDPVDLADQTGILAIPRRTYGGTDQGPMPIAPLTPEQMVALRPSRANDYGIERREMDPGRGNTGYFHIDEVTGAPYIAHSPKTKGTPKREITDRHEMAHAGLYMGDIPWSQLGTSEQQVARLRKDALDTLSLRIKRAKDPEQKAQLRAQRDDIKRASDFELYQRNPGEMIARLAEGNTTTLRAMRPTEVLNPHILPNLGPIRRGGHFVDQFFRGPRHYAVPMDLSRALFEDSLPFRDGGMVSAAEALMSTTPPPAAPAPKTPAPKKQPAQPRYKIERVMDGNGKYQTRFVEQA